MVSLSSIWRQLSSEKWRRLVWFINIKRFREELPVSIIYTVDGKNKFRQFAVRLQTSRYFIAAFCCRVDEICVLPGCYATYKPRKQQRKFSCWISWPFKIGPMDCPETSERNYHSRLRNVPEERRSQTSTSLQLKKDLLNQITINKIYFLTFINKQHLFWGVLICSCAYLNTTRRGYVWMWRYNSTCS